MSPPNSLNVLNMFSMVFGIPLSLGALLTGLALGLGTKWGILRYPWVIAKLLLIVSVMLVGAFVIGPAETKMLTGTGQATTALISGACYDVLALALATGLSVFKPGRRLARATPILKLGGSMVAPDRSAPPAELRTSNAGG